MHLASVLNGTLLLAMLGFPHARATEGESDHSLAAKQRTRAMLSGIRWQPTPQENPAREHAGIFVEKPVELPTMRIESRRWHDEREFTLKQLPKPILGTGVKPYRKGAIKVHSVLFIPFRVSIDF